MSMNVKKFLFFLITVFFALVISIVSGIGFLQNTSFFDPPPQNIFGNPFYKMVAMNLNIGTKVSYLPVVQIAIVSFLLIRLLLKNFDWTSYFRFALVFLLLGLFSPILRISSVLTSNAFGLILFLQVLVIFRKGKPKIRWYDIPLLLLGIWLFPHDFDLSFRQSKFIDFESRTLIFFVSAMIFTSFQIVKHGFNSKLSRFTSVSLVIASLVWGLEHFSITSTPFLSSIAVSIFLVPLALWIQESILKLKKNEVIVFGSLFLGVSLFSIGIHKSSHLENYHSPLWADKGGYFVYLPATFIHGFGETSEMKNESINNGHGFYFQEGKLMTKYSMGSAILMSPFFIWQLLCDSTDDISGFEEQYSNVVLIAGAFYFVLALFFLWRALRILYEKQTAIWIVSAIAFSTNIIFYAIDEAGMSHIYSFFCFSILIWISLKTTKPTNLSVVIMAGTSALLVLCRPINLIAIIPIFIIFSSKSFWKQLNIRFISMALITGFLLCLPQMLYWNYSWGNFIVDTYGSEGFIFDKFPPLKMFLFSPNNGYFLYAPILLLFFISLTRYFSLNLRKSFTYSLLMAGVVLLFASWEDVFYGCGYGSRVMVEYFSIFCFPMAYFFEKNSKGTRTVLWVITGILIVLNIHMMFNFDECYFSTNPWDWNEYFQIITKGLTSK